MTVTENLELVRIVLDHLVDKYQLHEKREGIHLSTLVYCLTKSQLDLSGSVLPTDSEVMLFALGLGLQDVLTPASAEAPVLTKDGIVYRPDFTLKFGENLNELKTTRMSASKGDRRDFPETWIEYMKGGCFITDKNYYDLIVLYMLGNYKPPFPSIKAYRFEFTDDELFNHWEDILARKEVYDSGLATGKLITPFKYCKKWECDYCRHRIICEAFGAGVDLMGGNNV